MQVDQNAVYMERVFKQIVVDLHMTGQYVIVAYFEISGEGYVQTIQFFNFHTIQLFSD
jgi:hypothetical protein